MSIQEKEADHRWMDVALAEAEAAAARGEVPVGAVLVGPNPGEMLASAGNMIVETKDPTAHAEMLVIRSAAKRLGNERLVGATLYVTLEPCAMCAGAISFARLKRLVYAASDPKGGAVAHGPKFFELSTCHHRPEVARMAGDTEAKASAILKDFFRARR
ncbi:MAG: nucleoside deaminase [Alphaproteobacteria bacterium]|nr:nucleoside deaminase [Alphaproteobacteria bacterium]